MKNFVKQISIYGILPVFGKFIGFFLIPIYTRVFSTHDFGILEIFITLVAFSTFLCNLEIYSAIGRFFYEKDDRARIKMISTGLYTTVFSSISVIIFLIIFTNRITAFFHVSNYLVEYRIAVIWLLVSAISTYLSVIPRYLKRAKQYVILSSIVILVRVFSTIFFVLILRIGIKGILLGHLAGATSGLLLYGWEARKLLSTKFDFGDLKAILKFSIPLVPGLFIYGLWQPLSRKLIVEMTTIETLGIVSFSLKLLGFLALAQSAIRLAWRPLLFESFTKPEFKQEISKISKDIGVYLLSFSFFFIIFGTEVVHLIGTDKYYNASLILGLLAIEWIILILFNIRGVGPLVNKKTYINSIVEFIHLALGVALLYALTPKYGLIGIGLAFVISSGIKYLLIIYYTKFKLKITFTQPLEYVLWMFVFAAVVLSIYNVNIILRITFSFALVVLLYFTMLRNIMQKIGKG
jgi:O-antigen/teichoic acid export membrane protein